MIFDLNIPEDKLKFKAKVDYLVKNGKIAELTEKKKTRSTLQNAALHLFFRFISDELNNIGLTFKYNGLKGIEIETMFTPNIVKEFTWKPIQKVLFKVESTTELNTEMINKIIDVIINFFAERGIEISFPSRIEDYMDSLNY